MTKGVLVDPFKELNDENLFKPDMKIYELYVCIDPEDGHIVGVEITLRTVASQVVGEYTLNIVGTSQGANCKPYIIPDDAYLKFLEVEYSFSKIWTLMIKVSNDYYSFWGDQPPSSVPSKFEKWDFTEEWQPVAFSGTADYLGVRSIAPVTYSMACAEKTIGIKIEPLGQEYNDNPQNQGEVSLRSTSAPNSDAA